MNESRKKEKNFTFFFTQNKSIQKKLTEYDEKDPEFFGNNLDNFFQNDIH